ncbi:FMN-binding negative transcriptional regulator [Shewanella sp. D64]|uniref:FMN-binding negative transcriptional regulator n=1 Tax=unclassified Shewanella TaxID=196818 RepID=UPI0022BA3F33|nr:MULTISPECIES: FMN-binding negative transcriptional regulator [unclassified Shewanella]MEC4728437.1 FMN-binding negative transcriptional regulator [Shewanella sp. D64]MEC4740465.1 FMN-binding negative transcriptional regulator [Shewanella sp. E94]WBJ94025.1 FMN-binding negative transcriptional regulator [Shewanella sp. MTB7]
MHIPETMKMGSNELIHQFIEEFSFGILITEQLEANHLPFMLKKSEGELGTLYGHFSRANRHLGKQDACNVMIILEGPHSYISPTWYASFPAVPTWNYVAVHLYGEMSFLSTDETIMTLDEMVDRYEPELLLKRELLTEEYRDKLAKGIGLGRS